MNKEALESFKIFLNDNCQTLNKSCNILSCQMFDALSNIKCDFYGKIGTDAELDAELNERIFAYEFYRQWANLIECSKSELMNILKKDSYENVVLYGEPVKWMRPIMDGKRQIYVKNKNLKDYWKVPDLILHSGPDDNKDQFIICEIKRFRNNNLGDVEKDLQSLTLFTNGVVKIDNNETLTTDVGKFALGVLLLVSVNKAEGSKFIKEYNLDGYNDRILCLFISESNGIEYTTLKTIKDEKD